MAPFRSMLAETAAGSGWQTIAVFLTVGVTLAWFGYRAWKNWSRKASGCSSGSCGCGVSKPGKPGKI